jgi:RNA polymerase sigma factor for flagellar operon FliA
MQKPEVAYRASNDEVLERNELVMRELPQVYYVAARIRERLPKHVEINDLVQAGVVGLLDACRNYDAEKDAQFSTFAKYRIRGAILDSLRKLDWGSRTLRRKGREIATTTAKLEAQLGRHPSEEELAAGMNIRLDELQGVVTQLDGLFVVGQVANVVSGDADSFDLIESAASDGTDNPFASKVK